MIEEVKAEIIKKICRKCGVEKDIHSFGNSLKEEDKKQKICKFCQREYSKLRYYIQKDKIANPDKYLKKEITTKVCSKCKIEKAVAFFSLQRKTKSGIRPECKQCVKLYSASVKKQIAERDKIYRENNKEKIDSYQRDYLKKNREKVALRRNRYYNKNKEKIKLYKKENSARENERRRNKRRTDIEFKIKDCLRSRLLTALKGKSKSSSTLDLLGCSIEFFKKYIEFQFEPGMSWENHTVDGWNLDHIKPCDSFNLTIAEEQRKCFHYSNLRPLWATTDIAKQNGSSRMGNKNKSYKILSEERILAEQTSLDFNLPLI